MAKMTKTPRRFRKRRNGLLRSASNESRQRDFFSIRDERWTNSVTGKDAPESHPPKTTGTSTSYTSDAIYRIFGVGRAVNQASILDCRELMF
jgi:hypothetical protein